MELDMNLYNCKYEHGGIEYYTVCNTCLANDRKLDCFERNTEAYKILAKNLDIQMPNYDAIYLCWECLAVINRFIKYKQQVVSAFITLSCIKNKQEFSCEPLSRLSITSNDVSNMVSSELTQIDTDSVKIELMPSDDDVAVDDDLYTEPLEVCELDIKPTKQSATRRSTRCSSKSKSKTKKSTSKSSSAKSKHEPKDVKNRIVDKFTMIEMSEEEMTEVRNAERLKKAYQHRPYKCDTCIYGYTEEKDLIKHNEKCHKKDVNSAQCNICEQYVSIKNISAHVREHYKIYQCLQCDERVYKCRKYHFLKNHDDSIHTCKTCGQSFVSIRTLYRHVTKSHRGTYTCEYCGKTFNMKGTYRVHVLGHNSLGKKCEVCNKIVKGKSNYNKHMRLCHSETTDPNAATNPNAYCAECDKQFKNIYIYRAHLKTNKNHVDEMFRCPDCEKSFTSKTLMKKHIDRMHLMINRYPCPRCERVLKKKTELVKHIQRVHEGIEPIRDKKCEQCGKMFFSQKTLTEHMRIHTGERPFICDLCGSTFSFRAALYTHTKLIHLKIKRQTYKRHRT